MACVVLKPAQVLSADELIAYCRRSLANYKLPRRIGFLTTELPKNGSGTILKRQLRDQHCVHETRRYLKRSSISVTTYACFQKRTSRSDVILSTDDPKRARTSTACVNYFCVRELL